MENELKIQDIRSMIFTVRGMQVMLDSDLAKVYGVDSKRLNEQVKRNNERFPIEFRFQLTKEESDNLRSHFATSSWGGRRYLPYVFTEQGVSMLSSVLRSETAIKVSITIINAFVEMRRFLVNNASVFQRLDNIEIRQLMADKKIEELFKALEKKDDIPNQGVFFDGQFYSRMDKNSLSIINAVNDIINDK
jgi:hypothetical protein